MQVLATVSKTTKGHTTTWRFCEVAGQFLALRDNNKVIACKSKEDMRSLYTQFTTNKKYGFTPVLV